MTAETSSPIRIDRIERAQGLMREQGVAAIVVMNHDDYRWFSASTGRSHARSSRLQAHLP